MIEGFFFPKQKLPDQQATIQQLLAAGNRPAIERSVGLQTKENPLSNFSSPDENLVPIPPELNAVIDSARGSSSEVAQKPAVNCERRTSVLFSQYLEGVPNLLGGNFSQLLNVLIENGYCVNNDTVAVYKALFLQVNGNTSFVLQELGLEENNDQLRQFGFFGNSAYQYSPQRSLSNSILELSFDGRRFGLTLGNTRVTPQGSSTVIIRLGSGANRYNRRFR